MDLLRRRTLRAASLALILVALAAPAHALPYSPIMEWDPGWEYGDPDTGGGGISYMRFGRHVLILVARRIMAPTSPIVAPNINDLRLLWGRQR